MVAVINYSKICDTIFTLCLYAMLTAYIALLKKNDHYKPKY